MTWNAFDSVFRPWMQRRIRTCIAGAPSRVADGTPILLVANHVSWWDGFLLRAVQRDLRPQSVLYTLALERELRSHPILRFTGGIGVDPASPSSVLRAVRRFETNRREFPDAVFAYFPQGCIAPSFKRPLEFRRGVELFARALAPLTVLPVAIHIEPITNLAPTAFVTLGNPFASDGNINHHDLERQIHALLDETLAFVAKHGERAEVARRDTRPAAAMRESALVRDNARVVDALIAQRGANVG
jgi:1-acyl-sn-glycerol-3-phosphate acyltransferase